MRLLGISGSLRADSYNTALLRAASELAPADVEFEIFDGLGEVPLYDADREPDGGPGVERLRTAVSGADALLVATPEYNGSLSGVLKNAIDWASRPAGAGALRDKPVVAVSVSTGSFGGMWAQADLKKILGIAGARVIDPEQPQLAVAKAQERFSDGRLSDEPTRQALEQAVDALVAAVEASSPQLALA